MHRPKTSRATVQRMGHAGLRRFLLPTLISVGVVFSVSDTARASLFSFFAGDNGVTEVTTKVEVLALNSQTMVVLEAARNVDPDLSRGGGALSVADGVAVVPEESPFVDSVADTVAPANPDQISWYIVQEGDTLSQVAGLFNVSVNTIVWANELGSAKDIHPGQTLLILPISGVQHTVAKGDTVKSLAGVYGGDASEIIAYNNLPEDGTLTAGAVITIPGGAIAEEEEEEKGTDSTPSASSGTIVSSGPSVSGYFIHPLPGAVRTQGVHGYNGVDYGASVGTQVRASAAGTVIVSRGSGWNGGYGQYVVIDHPNGTQTLYAHLSKNTVWQGQKVVAGQVVGNVGNTGRSTGPHLHFEVRGAKNPF